MVPIKQRGHCTLECPIQFPISGKLFKTFHEEKIRSNFLGQQSRQDDSSNPSKERL